MTRSGTSKGEVSEMTHEREKVQGGGESGEVEVDESHVVFADLEHLRARVAQSRRAEEDGRVTPQLLQSALDAQIRDLAEQELDSLEGWYQELNAILEDVEQVRARIDRFRLRVNARIIELEPELEQGL